MMSRTQSLAFVGAFFVALTAAPGLAAQAPATLHHYKLIDVGTFGGSLSAINMAGDVGGRAVNLRGATVGFSATATPKLLTSDPLMCGGDDGFGSFITHAFRLQDDAVADLQALPPAETNCSNAYRINGSGEIVGSSETGAVDPLTGIKQTRAVHWKDGQIEKLGSFGGNQNGGLAINDVGQIVGFSLNSTPDPFSLFDSILNAPNATQTRAVLWQHGQMRDLGTLGANDAGAFTINNAGQIAGVSSTNSTPNPVTGIPTVDPFFGENGTMVDIGSFGGAYGQPTFLNNRGQVIGGSSVPANARTCLFEDYPNCHPFLWEKGNLLDLATTTVGGVPLTADGINEAGEIVGGADFSSTGGSFFGAYLWRNGVATDLGSVPGDCASRALAINSRGQVVGNSFWCTDPNGPFHNAFLWENGSIIDLNDVIPAGSSLQLVAANDINDRGEIAGEGVPPGVDPANFSTQGHAFLLIPCDQNHPGVEGCDYSLVAASFAVPQSSPALRGEATVSPASLLHQMSRNHLPDRATGPRK